MKVNDKRVARLRRWLGLRLPQRQHKRRLRSHDR